MHKYVDPRNINRIKTTRENEINTLIVYRFYDNVFVLSAKKKCCNINRAMAYLLKISRFQWKTYNLSLQLNFSYLHCNNYINILMMK